MIEIKSALLSAAFAFLFTAIDGEIIKEGFWIREKGHAVRAIMRLYVLTLIALVFTHNPLYVIALTGLNGSVFWIVFDYSLNWYRGKPFFYVGKTAKLDVWFKNHIHVARIQALVIFIIACKHISGWN